MCVSAGLPFPEEEIDRLIQTCPKDEEDKVSFEDFIVHLEKSQMELINGPEEPSRAAPKEEARNEDPFEKNMNNNPWQQAPAEFNALPVLDPIKLQQENDKLKSTIRELQDQLNDSTDGQTISNSLPEPSSNIKPVLPQITPAADSLVAHRVTRSNNPNKGISNVFPDNEGHPQIDMFGQARQEPKVFGRRKYKVVDPPTEDIFGNKIKIQIEKIAPPPPPQQVANCERPKPEIGCDILENIRACMDRNNKRALKDVTSTIERWNGGCIMTRRMLTKIIKHSGLRLPNETVRILFDKLDVYADGSVVLNDFFKVFKDAENSVPRGGNDPGQISRNRRAEMQNRAAPWATM